MSAYAVVLRAIKENPGKTPAELEALVPMEAVPVTDMLVMLVADGRVTQTGTGDTATYSSTSEE
jgi:hypothetical protein